MAYPALPHVIPSPASCHTRPRRGRWAPCRVDRHRICCVASQTIGIKSHPEWYASVHASLLAHPRPRWSRASPRYACQFYHQQGVLAAGMAALASTPRSRSSNTGCTCSTRDPTTTARSRVASTPRSSTPKCAAYVPTRLVAIVCHHRLARSIVITDQCYEFSWSGSQFSWSGFWQ